MFPFNVQTKIPASLALEGIALSVVVLRSFNTTVNAFLPAQTSATRKWTLHWLVLTKIFACVAL